jgi:hypothetical protein
MRSLILILMVVILLAMPGGVSAQSGRGGMNLPLRVQAPVREGDFAVGLVAALDMGTVGSEREAMGLLVSYGIEPEHGWISNHPMTFKIFNDLEEAVRAAAETRELPMGKEEAVEAVENLALRLGLPVVIETSFQTVAQMFPRPGEYKLAPAPSAPLPEVAVPPSPVPAPKPQGPSTIAPDKGAFNPRTGEFYPGTFGGAYNPRTGNFYPKVNGGYLDYQNGTLLPEKK